MAKISLVAGVVVSMNGTTVWDTVPMSLEPGTIDNRLYGVAPGANLWVTRVFDCEEKGAKAITIRAINWCAQKAREIGGKCSKLVAGWSLQSASKYSRSKC